MDSIVEDKAAALKRAQQHMYQGAFAAATELLDGILASDPADKDARYFAAVCARYRGQSEAARKHLDTLKAAAPDFGRAYQEEGHLLRHLGRNADALTAYRHACRLNPALEGSWRALSELLSARGLVQEAAHAAQQADRLAALPKELQAVSNFLHEGRLYKAEKLCRAFLQKNPENVEGMRLLAELGSRFGVYEDAEFLLENAAAFDPDNVQVRLDYIQVLRRRQKFQAALEQARALYDRNPLNPLFQSHYAIESLQTGDFDTALQLFDSVLEQLPNDPATLTSRGHALKTYGRYDEAVASYRAAFAAKPNHGDAFYALANLKTYRFTDAEIEAMQAQEAAPDTLPTDRIHLCFALGKAYEDQAAYDTAFSYYARGNALKREQSRYDATQMSEELAAQKAVCTAELFERHGGHGDPAPDPIFIVGLPRAGSTLIEQILAAHSQVDGTLELPNILALSHRLRGRRRLSEKSAYPEILRELPPDKFAEMGADYIENTRLHRQSAPFFTDKMPNNFRHIGLIHLILPNAKIIDARRHPMACCFSGFKQLFAEGQEFTYSLEDMGRYYRDYVDLMRHWDSVLPGRILRVQYEDMITDFEAQVHRLLDFCGLPFEASCLEFHRNERAVRTASSEQVRQPLYDKAMVEWENFAAHLNGLRQALGPALTDYRD